jgi:hypothetical protein
MSFNNVLQVANFYTVADGINLFSAAAFNKNVQYASTTYRSK